MIVFYYLLSFDITLYIIVHIIQYDGMNNLLSFILLVIQAYSYFLIPIESLVIVSSHSRIVNTIFTIFSLLKIRKSNTKFHKKLDGDPDFTVLVACR